MTRWPPGAAVPPALEPLDLGAVPDRACLEVGDGLREGGQLADVGEALAADAEQFGDLEDACEPAARRGRPERLALEVAVAGAALGADGGGDLQLAGGVVAAEDGMMFAALKCEHRVAWIADPRSSAEIVR